VKPHVGMSGTNSVFFLYFVFFFAGIQALRRKIEKTSVVVRSIFSVGHFRNADIFRYQEIFGFCLSRYSILENAFNWAEIWIFDGPLTSIHIDPFQSFKVKDTWRPPQVSFDIGGFQNVDIFEESIQI